MSPTMLPGNSRLQDRLAVLPQYLLPKQCLTRWAGSVATARAAWTRRLIPWFIARYGVDMPDAVDPDPLHYATFNEFFIRALRPGARPIAPAPFISPVDGEVVQYGGIDGDQLLQAKGHRYSVCALLAGEAALAESLRDGTAVTLYLSPRDYHRIHMPCDGRLLGMTYVPGSLFSVNPATVRGIPGLFARNERVICLFEAATGPFVMTLVGATIVGGIATTWHGSVNPQRNGEIRRWSYTDNPVELRRGEEMGRFFIGSTVVMLFTAGTLRLRTDWTPGRRVRLGDPMVLAT
jgi:phosphatidylserine decarboxylase